MENVLASSTSSFDFSRNDKLTGIKMLLKLKNAQKIYDNYIGGNDNPEEYIDEIMKNEKNEKTNMYLTFAESDSVCIHRVSGKRRKTEKFGVRRELCP